MTPAAAPSLPEFIQQIKDMVGIEQIVREYVPTLSRSGASLKARCPFHNEKTPSFYVHPEMGFYHCFGCGAHGDVIRFVQEIEKIEFRLVLEQLARRAGLPMPTLGRGSPDEHEEDQKRLGQLREVCTWAEQFFIDQLRRHPRGAVARDYLCGRGLTDSEIERYHLGYAPPGYENLLEAAARRGWRPETLAEAGLAGRNDSGSFHDRFRDRLIFPIADRSGQIIAFAGRLIEAREDAPKYINSPETPIFKKGRMLYGMAAAREPIKDSGAVILLEGYMDWIAMHRAGLGNVLAGMGTALGDGQARMLRGIARRVILLYDGDEAGQKAMFRATELLLAQSLDVRAAALPAGEDPDSFLAREGREAMRLLLDQAPPAVDHFIRSSAESCNLTRPEGKAEAVGRLAPLLLAIEEPALREGYMTRAAERIGLRLATLEEVLRRRRGRQSPPAPSPFSTSSGQHEEGGGEAVALPEQYLLYTMLRSEDPWSLACQIEPGWFQDAELRSVFEVFYDSVRDIREGAPPPADWFELFPEERQKEWVSRILLLPMRRFGGELADFDAYLMEGFQAQRNKLQRIATKMRKQRLLQDLQMILGESLGSEQLEAIHDLSAQDLRRMEKFLEGQSHIPS